MLNTEDRPCNGVGKDDQAAADQKRSCNIDAELDFAMDIDPFVLALTDPDAYALQYPACDGMRADCDGNGTVDGLDIASFVYMLTH